MPRAAVAEKEAQPADNSEPATEDIADTIRKSLVIVRATGRDGREYGHGTGFVISKDGLIATARHVIGDRRAVNVELPDGRQIPATHIHAVTESVDLAVLKVEATDLIPLSLGDASDTKAGQSVVTVGFPGSTQYSVYRGLISGRHDIDGISMLKLAMTVEPGSSGEPVVSQNGHVVGIVTLKSTESSGVGYAVPIDHLKALLEDPADMPMSRWMTIGALDEKQWNVLWDANWRQRASRVLVDGFGTAFGGRSLCLSVADPPDIPFELQVEVRLDDESGAAGLAFHADADDRHYGFYPSAGKVRLTRFNGPDLNSWTILYNESVPAYRSGEWNKFKVRVEKDRFQCFVNEQLAVESTDTVLKPGQVGLATFRGTSASFRRFRVGRSIPSALPGEADAARIAEILQEVKASRPASADTISKLRPFTGHAAHLLEHEAQQLELKAKHMRLLVSDLHTAEVRDQILAALGRGDTAETPNLLKAALLIAVLDNNEIDTDSYIERVDRLALEAMNGLAEDASEAERLEALNRMLFKEYGFRGSRYEYYTRSNSYLNEVIDDREGLPITLSVLYIELARRMNLKIVGLGLPGHFVVRLEPSNKDSEPQIIDVFARGKTMSVKEAEEIVKGRGFPLLPKFFEAQSESAIVERMLLNLLALAEQSRKDDGVLRYLETLVGLDGSNPEYRAKRLELRARTGRLAEAIQDANWFIDEQPDGTNSDRLYELRAELLRQQALQK